MDLLADLEARGLVQDSTDRDAEVARHEVGAVVRAHDAQRLGELPGSVREIDVALGLRTTRTHLVDAADRLDGTDQHREPLTVLPAHRVAAPVHPVGEVHVEVPGSAEHDLGARRHPAVGVRTRVDVAHVRLGLDDAA